MTVPSLPRIAFVKARVPHGVGAHVTRCHEALLAQAKDVRKVAEVLAPYELFAGDGRFYSLKCDVLHICFARPVGALRAVLYDETGREIPVTPEFLHAFAAASEAGCVVLNGCWSEELADAIFDPRQRHVIGLPPLADDEARISLTRTLVDRLTDRRPAKSWYSVIPDILTYPSPKRTPRAWVRTTDCPRTLMCPARKSHRGRPPQPPSHGSAEKRGHIVREVCQEVWIQRTCYQIQRPAEGAPHPHFAHLGVRSAEPGQATDQLSSGLIEDLDEMLQDHRRGGRISPAEIVRAFYSAGTVGPLPPDAELADRLSAAVHHLARRSVPHTSDGGPLPLLAFLRGLDRLWSLTEVSRLVERALDETYPSDQLARVQQHRMLEAHRVLPAPAALVVHLEPMMHGKGVAVSAWLHHDKFAAPDPLLLRGTVRTVDDAWPLLRPLWEDLRKCWGDRDLTIELVVPDELLEHPFEYWLAFEEKIFGETRSRLLGQVHPVVVRYAQAQVLGVVRDRNVRWGAYQGNPVAVLDLHTGTAGTVSAVCREVPAGARLLATETFLCLVMAEMPTSSMHSSIGEAITAGVPSVVWSRNGASVRRELAELPRDLPLRVLGERKVDPKLDIVLLWEGPGPGRILPLAWSPGEPDE